jgi:hypothetical protein
LYVILKFLLNSPHQLSFVCHFVSV